MHLLYYTVFIMFNALIDKHISVKLCRLTFLLPAVAISEYDPRDGLVPVEVDLVDDASTVVKGQKAAVEHHQLGQFHPSPTVCHVGRQCDEFVIPRYTHIIMRLYVYCEVTLQSSMAISIVIDFIFYT